MMLRVAAIQMNSGPTVDDNLTAATRWLERAASDDTRLAVLPENVAIMPERAGDRRAIAETPGDGPIQHWLTATAARLGMWIAAGTLPLVVPGDDTRVTPTLLLAAPDGTVHARYDKMHLFDVGLPDADTRTFRESDDFVAGDAPVVADVDGIGVGLTVCYDLRFPELYRHLAGQGARVFVAPSAFTHTTGQAHWDVLLRARAVENLAFMIGANQTGHHPRGHHSWGHSMIVDPWGRVIAETDESESMITGALDLGQLDAIRQRFPALQHRRLG